MSMLTGSSAGGTSTLCWGLLSQTVLDAVMRLADSDDCISYAAFEQCVMGTRSVHTKLMTQPTLCSESDDDDNTTLAHATLPGCISLQGVLRGAVPLQRLEIHCQFSAG